MRTKLVRKLLNFKTKTDQRCEASFKKTYRMNSRTVAILIRKPERSNIYFSVAEQLSQTGANLEMFLLGPIPCAAMGDATAWSAQFVKMGVKCFTDTPSLLKLNGFQVADTAELARRIGKADMVIPL